MRLRRGALLFSAVAAESLGGRWTPRNIPGTLSGRRTQRSVRATNRGASWMGIPVQTLLGNAGEPPGVLSAVSGPDPVTSNAAVVPLGAALIDGSHSLAQGARLLPAWFPLIAFALIGALLAVAVLGYLFRTQRNPTTLLKALGGGSISAAGLGAMGTRVAGLEAEVTWTEAALVTTSAFVVICGILTITLLFLFWLMIVRPIKRRLGAQHATRVWVEFLAGMDPLKDWIRETIRTVQADQAWDEFTCGFAEVIEELNDLERHQEVLGGTVAIMKATSPSEARADEMSIKVLKDMLGRTIEHLSSRMTQTTLNFTVWRVATGAPELEHLLSLPVDHGHELGHGHKPRLPVWHRNVSRDANGCLAAAAMLAAEYMMTKALPDKNDKSTQFSRRWPRRQLGIKYDAIAAMPVPCDGGDVRPWAVICVESRDGSLPLEGHAIRMLMGLLARVVDATRPLLFRRTIDDTRWDSAADHPAKTKVDTRKEPTVSSPASTAFRVPPGSVSAESGASLSDASIEGKPAEESPPRVHDGLGKGIGS